MKDGDYSDLFEVPYGMLCRSVSLHTLQKHQKDYQPEEQAHQTKNDSPVDVQKSYLRYLSVDHGSTLLLFYVSMSTDPQQKGSHVRSIFFHCGTL